MDVVIERCIGIVYQIRFIRDEHFETVPHWKVALIVAALKLGDNTADVGFDGCTIGLHLRQEVDDVLAYIVTCCASYADRVEEWLPLIP